MTNKSSSAKERESIAVTVYNQSFGVVREVRTVDLAKGRVALEFQDVSTQIEPNTVSIKSHDDSGDLSVLEQNYRYDIITPQKILEKNEGKKVKIYRYSTETGKEQTFDAEVLSVKEGGPVLKIGDEITFGLDGRYAFSELPKNLVAKPSLVWLLESGKDKQKVEVSYLTRGLNWAADYVLSLGEEDVNAATSKADLVGWVTLTNNTGTAFENAQLKLVAGDVQRVSPDEDNDGISDQPMQRLQSESKNFKEESFFEYHLYSLDRPTDLLSNEQKQATLLSASGITVTRRLIFYGASGYYRSSYGQIASNQKVGVYLEIENKEDNRMGMPLPKGTVRVYKADKSGTKQFIGEDNIDHTPRDEQIRIKMGESFDVVGDRKQTNYKVLSTCGSESEWEVALRNHKDTADEIWVSEPMEGDWSVLSSSLPFEKKDAHTIIFKVKVPARGEQKLTYKSEGDVVLKKLLPLTLLAVTVNAQQVPKPVAMKSTSQQREEVAITVYNQNFGLVREVRNVDMASGRVALEFRDVSQSIQPETVSIKALGGTQLKVLEQNYRYDLLSPQKLLEKYVGKKVKIYRYNDKTGKEDELDAEVLSVSQGTVLKIGNEVTYDYPGRFAFPQVPDNLIAQPTLVWLLDSGAAKQKIEVTYLTSGLNWNADYVFTINDADTAGDINGWVTLVNQTGNGYENAKLKLVAGDVQRIRGQVGYGQAAREPMTKSAEDRQFKEESFFEYHLYTLERPTNLLQNEQKQVTLLEAQGIKVDKRLIFYGAAYYYRGNYGQVVANQKVGVYLDFENRESNKMGMPLPKGTVRVYKADKSGAKQFIGEDMIDHTPRDEKVRIKMGEAFDVVGDRKQMEWKALGSCTSESSWQIELRNHKDTATEVEVYEPVGGDWEIVQESMVHEKKDAHTFVFKPKIAARGDVKITYRVRIKWC